MTSLAPTLQSFFIDRLIRQRNASPNTVAVYRDTFRLLFAYLVDATGKSPARLDFTDVDTVAVGGFLHHLEAERGNSVRTRNTRLSAIHSFFEFAALRHPEHAELIQRVLAIPDKRFNTAVVSFLTRPELDALLASPDRATWTGQRDHALMVLAVQTGLLASPRWPPSAAETSHSGQARTCGAQGRVARNAARPSRSRPPTCFEVWMQTRRGQPQDPLFPSHGSNRGLTRGAIWRVVAKHAAAAASRWPSIADKHPRPTPCATPPR